MRTLRCLVHVPLLALAGAWATQSVAAGMEGHEVDPETRLETWRWHDESFYLELTQRLPDQTRAFFLGRGFDSAAAEDIARACVFQAEIRNVGSADSGIAVRINLADWRVVSSGARRALLVRQAWKTLWQQRGVSEAAQIAFHWSLFPTEQKFLPGDYNWGMIALGPPPGEPLALHLSWESSGEKRGGVLRNILCAPDRSVE